MKANFETFDDPKIFREVRKFLKKINDPTVLPIEKLTPVDARIVLIETQTAAEVDYSGIEESEYVIVQEGNPINFHIVRPQGVESTLPVFVFIHGGGWVLGDYATHRRLVRDLVVRTGAVAVFPDYALSPEARYPTAINQIYQLVNWLAKNGEEIGVDGSRMGIAGNSVGGNMSAAITLMAKEKEGPLIACQVLFWPVTDANFETESYNLFAEGRFLTKNMMKWFWDAYIENPKDRNNRFVSPLRALHSELVGLPPTLIQTAENDVLRDEGEEYARKLDEAGVEVVLTRFQGQIHDFGMLNPLAHIPATKLSILEAAVFMKEKLFR